MSLPASRVDKGVAAEVLLAVAPMAVDAAKQAEKMARQQAVEQARVAGLELEQARYDARLAERRYAACDPDNRLIAAQLERAWQEALRRVQACEQRLDGLQCSIAPAGDGPDLAGLAANLESTWNAPNTSMRARQRLVRTLVEDIVADVDRNEILLMIRWKGGQHSSVRVRKPATGEHGCKTADEALAVIRTMAGRWPDEQIATSLNRMGMQTGQAMGFRNIPSGEADESLPEEIRVLDPRHPLFGQSFRVLGRSSHRGGNFALSCEVEYRNGATLLVPLAATEHRVSAGIATKLCMASLRDLLDVVDRIDHEHGTGSSPDDTAAAATTTDRRRHRRCSGGGLA